MTIEIHRPELEALIRERMKNGAFRSVEDVLLQALQMSSLPGDTGRDRPTGTSVPTGADLIAAMQSSPHKEIDLESPRGWLPVRESSF